jgi:hypothetical protein
LIFSSSRSCWCVVTQEWIMCRQHLRGEITGKRLPFNHGTDLVNIGGPMFSAPVFEDQARETNSTYHSEVHHATLAVWHRFLRQLIVLVALENLGRGPNSHTGTIRVARPETACSRNASYS